MNPKALATVSEHNMEPRVMDYTQSAIDTRDTSSKLWHCLKLPPYTKISPWNEDSSFNQGNLSSSKEMPPHVQFPFLRPKSKI